MARTAGDRRSLAALSALALAAALQPVACDGDPKGTDTELARAIARVLEDVGPEVVVPTLDRAAAAADALVVATGVWAQDPASDAARADAQAAWQALMAVWQEAELHQLGPAGPSLTVIAGEALRDEVYSWPTINPCRVDQETVTTDWSEPSFFDDELVNVYGLDALETLLFSEPGVNACPSQVDINANGSWDALGVDGVQQHRAEYAAAAAARVAADIATLRDRWTGGFSDTLADAGASGSPYETADAGLNAVFDALYYLELETQDQKLIGPLDRGEVELVETPVAGGSHEWIAANLRGFRLLFTGGEGDGMDDLLAELGHGDVSDAMLAALDEADAAALALTVPIDEAVATDPAPARALLEAVRQVTGLLEGDVATLLALRIPSEAAGDND